jgi:hypothetical protein
LVAGVISPAIKHNNPAVGALLASPRLGGASAAPTLICLITAVKIQEHRDQEIYLQIFPEESQMEIEIKVYFRR